LLKIDKAKLIEELARGEFVVEAVLDKKMVGGKPRYLIKWKGHSHDYDMWESPQDSFKAAIQKYEESKPAPKPAPAVFKRAPAVSKPTPVVSKPAPPPVQKVSLSQQFDQIAAAAAGGHCM
jgi:hypothetical protein